MAVKLELYRIFRTVAEEKSISAAAKTLFISQSAVSQSIHQLEEQLQVRLFSRQPRGVTLTGEGRLLYDYVRSAISLIETGEEKLQQSRELMMGQLVIGASDTVTRSLLLPYLQRFHRAYPAIRLKVLNGTSYEALQMLRMHYEQSIADAQAQLTASPDETTAAALKARVENLTKQIAELDARLAELE